MQNFATKTNYVVEKELRVDAISQWNDTEIDIYPDSFVTIVYRGGFCRINESFRFFDADGYTTKKAQAGYLLMDQSPGCLVGKIGNSLFHIGKGKVVHNQSGRLYLAINQFISSLAFNQLISDNSYFNVKVTVIPYVLIK